MDLPKNVVSFRMQKRHDCVKTCTRVSLDPYLLSGSADLGLFGAPHFLHSVLALLLLLSRGLGTPLDHTLPRESKLGLELFGEVHCVVDEGEAGALAAAKVGLESVGENAVGSGLVHLGQLLPDLGLGHRRSVGVKHVHHHLAPLQQPVGHILARTHGNSALGLKL